MSAGSRVGHGNAASESIIRAMPRTYFLECTALERQLLADGVPAASLVASSDTYTFSKGGGHTHIHLNLVDDLGAQAQAILRRRMTVLFFGMAWKVLDMAMELALKRVVPGKIPHQASEKKKLLCKHHGGELPEVPALIWQALAQLYQATIEVRNALVHRQAEVVHGVLQTRTKDGAALPELSHLQQVQFCELVQRMSIAIERGNMTLREERQCEFLLWSLRDLHGIAQLPPRDGTDIGRVRFSLPEDCMLPVAAIKTWMQGAKPGHTGIDLELEDQRSGRAFYGELDHVTDEAVRIDVQNPPVWLTPRVVPPAAAGAGD